MALFNKSLCAALAGVLSYQTALVSASDQYSAPSSLSWHSDYLQTASNDPPFESKYLRERVRKEKVHDVKVRRKRARKRHTSDDGQGYSGSRRDESKNSGYSRGSEQIPSNGNQETKAENGNTVGSDDINAASQHAESNADQADDATVAQPESLEKEMLGLINRARSTARQCGNKNYPAVSPLNWNKLLEAAAASHSEDMARHNFLSHTGSDGLNVSDRVSTEGYAWRSIGENIAAGYGTAKAVVDGWLSSPGHCANIMSSTYSELGGALVEDSTSDYQSYWTLVVAKPR
jgi:uncharacterized protein YkwD